MQAYLGLCTRKWISCRIVRQGKNKEMNHNPFSYFSLVSLNFQGIHFLALSVVKSLLRKKDELSQ